MGDMRSKLKDLLSALENEFDVEDGIDGPRPNIAMRIYSEIEDLLAKHPQPAGEPEPAEKQWRCKCGATGTFPFSQEEYNTHLGHPRKHRVEVVEEGK